MHRACRESRRIGPAPSGLGIRWTNYAACTDPDGIDELIGGGLQDEAGTIDYGTFVTRGQEGAYTLKVSWDEVNQARTLSFQVAQIRSFRAVFFDMKGNAAGKTADIRSRCDKVQWLSGACDGACLSLTSDYNCGTCGTWWALALGAKCATRSVNTELQ